MSNNRAMDKLRGVMQQIENLADERKRDIGQLIPYLQRVIADPSLCKPEPLTLPFDGPFADGLPRTEEWKLSRDFSSTREPTIECFTFDYCYNWTRRGPEQSDREYDRRPQYSDAGRQHAEWILKHQKEVLDSLGHELAATRCCDLLFPGTHLIDPDGHLYMLVLLYIDDKYLPSHCRVDIRREPPDHPTCRVVRIH